MAAVNLTVKAIENLKPAVAGREVFDAHTRGLTFAIRPSGSRSWAFRYRRPVDGKARKLTLGSYPAIGLSEARRLASEAAGAVARGGDPAGDKIAARTHAKASAARPGAGETTAAAIDLFIRRHATVNNRPKTWREAERALKRELAPWSSRPLADIRPVDIHAILDGKLDAGAPIMANRLLAVMRRFFRFAVERNIITASPCVGIGAPAPAKSRDRILDDAELAIVWHAAGALGWPFAPLYRLLVLTGARRDEVASMRWSEVDTPRGLWTLPKERAKNGREHVIPLSPIALDILAPLPRIDGPNDFVFTTNGRTAVSGFGHAKARLDAAIVEPMPKWVTHDLRRTFASGLARLGVNLPVIEKLLNHTSGSFGGIVGVYQRHSFAEEKKTAIEVWSKHVAAVINRTDKTNVVTLRRNTDLSVNSLT